MLKVHTYMLVLNRYARRATLRAAGYGGVWVAKGSLLSILAQLARTVCNSRPLQWPNYRFLAMARTDGRVY